MTGSQRLLCIFYALVALAALAATWSQNLAYFGAGAGFTDALAAFIEGTRATPAARSITIDIGFLLLAAAAFMIIEARRLGVSFVWLYLLGGFLIAISVTFPLFMIAREMRLSTPQAANPSWRMTPLDLAGLAVIAALVLALTWRVLT